MSRIGRPALRIALLCCAVLTATMLPALVQRDRIQAQQDFRFNEFERQGEREPSPAEILLVVVFYGSIIAVYVVVSVVVCFILSSYLRAVPPQFRLMEPGMVWLLLIPCFSFVWMFFVYIRIAKSYQNYFRSIGRYDVGDCGEMIGLWYCICFCCRLIPCLGAISGIAALILLIVYLIQVGGLKSQVMASAVPMKWGPQY